MKKILYIHGAFSSGTSFQRIKEQLPDHTAITAEYSADCSLEHNIQYLMNLIENVPHPVDVVGHSLGGILAMFLAQRSKSINAVVTISAPLGGSRMSEFISWFSNHELYRSINRYQEFSKLAPTNRHLAIVTTSGNNPMMYEPNDGVVAIKSQMAMSQSQIAQLPLNHFEVLLSDKTISLIQDFIF